VTTEHASTADIRRNGHSPPPADASAEQQPGRSLRDPRTLRDIMVPVLVLIAAVFVLRKLV
jgi:hypothetical protein